MRRSSSTQNTFALVAVCLSALMLGLEITSIPSILPTLEAVLPATFRQLQWIMNAYTIAMCAVLMAMGALGDAFGRKRVFVTGTVVFALASLACGLAVSAPVLIAARFLQGLSGAAMLSAQVAVLSHQFRDGAERGWAFGWWGIVFGIGLGFGPIVGGAIVTLTSWHWVFLIHVILAAITVLFTLRGVEESKDHTAVGLDLAGMVTLSVSVFGLVFLITQWGALGLSGLSAYAVMAGCAASFGVFLIVETCVARPMFDFRAFRVRAFSGALLGAGGMNFSFWPFVIYLPIYLQAGLGYGPMTVGLTVLAYTLPTIVVPPFAERLLLRRGPRFVIPLGLLTIGAGFLLLMTAATADGASWMTLLPGCVLAGIGLGLTNTPVSNTATGALPPERGGMASGMDMSARMISLSVNIAVMGLILSGSIGGYLQRAVPALADHGVRQGLADRIAAGNLEDGLPYGISPAQAVDALAHGVGQVTLYGAVCALMLACLSFAVFGRQAGHR